MSTKNFGLLVAYVIPGFVLVASASAYSDTVQSWLAISPAQAPTIGGFLYVTLASVAAGMTVSALRWLLLDTLHHHTGISRPQWNLSNLPANLPGFEAFVEHHYRYYQFYGNVLVAMGALLFMPRSLLVLLPIDPFVLGGLMASLMVLFYIASRDALAKYYARTSLVLGVPHSKEPTNDQRLPLREERSQTGKQGPTGPGAKSIGTEERPEWWR